MRRIGYTAGFALILLVLSTTAQAQQQKTAPPLQFADLGGISTWQAGGPRLLYIKDKKGQWFKVDMLEACMDLYPGKEPGFVTESDTSGQRYSGVELDHHQCTVLNITKTTEPPPVPYVAPPRKAATPSAAQAQPPKK